MDALIADRLREAERFRRYLLRSHEVPDLPYSITVRFANEGDAEAIARLCELEGRRLPSGRALIAEVEGAVVAVRSLENGETIADPFKESAQFAELLAVRSAQLRHAGGRGGRRGGQSVRGFLFPFRRDRRISVARSSASGR
jgi:hypothetical protein